MGSQRAPKRHQKTAHFHILGPLVVPRGLDGGSGSLQPPFWAQIRQIPPKNHPKSQKITQIRKNHAKIRKNPLNFIPIPPAPPVPAGSCRFLPVPAGSCFPPAQLLRRFLMDAAVSRSVSNIKCDFEMCGRAMDVRRPLCMHLHRRKHLSAKISKSDGTKTAPRT